MTFFNKLFVNVARGVNASLVRFAALSWYQKTPVLLTGSFVLGFVTALFLMWLMNHGIYYNTPGLVSIFQYIVKRLRSAKAEPVETPPPPVVVEPPQPATPLPPPPLVKSWWPVRPTKEMKERDDAVASLKRLLPEWSIEERARLYVKREAVLQRALDDAWNVGAPARKAAAEATADYNAALVRAQAAATEANDAFSINSDLQLAWRMRQIDPEYKARRAARQATAEDTAMAADYRAWYDRWGAAIAVSDATKSEMLMKKEVAERLQQEAYSEDVLRRQRVAAAEKSLKSLRSKPLSPWTGWGW